MTACSPCSHGFVFRPRVRSQAHKRSHTQEALKASSVRRGRPASRQVDRAVSRGTVEVRPADRLDAQPTRVTVGQEQTHTEGQEAQVLKVADNDQAFAWTNGQLIYRDQPLSTVAADLTRRFGTPIRTADARTGALRFSGVLVTDNETDVLRRLTAYAPVRVERTSTEVILHAR